MKKYSATEIIAMMDRIEACYGNHWWGRLKEQLETIESKDATPKSESIHAEDCAINVGMLGECDCGMED